MRTNLDRKPSVPHNGEMENSNPKNTTYNNTDLPAGKPSFVSIVHDSSKSSTNTSQPAKPRIVSLIDQDLISIDDATKVLSVKLKEIDSMGNMYLICRNEGFMDVEIHHIGGLWIWIQFPTSDACVAFQSKESIKAWDFMQSHSGKYVLFGDMNEVRSEQERRGSIFSRNKVDVSNSFIDNAGLIGLPIGVYMFTWMNKAGSKLSKLDRFLISEEVLSFLHDIKVTSLDPLWSDHTPILLDCNKCDFGLVPFKLYHSWFTREELKPKIKQWVAITKSHEDTSKQVVMKDLRIPDEKIDVGLALSDDHDARIKLLPPSG
ncbi:RNA-directed DNA polymerase, eukaryota, reverse transcriptase zinc-binding domain protein [Tanacetum coccineum]